MTVERRNVASLAPPDGYSHVAVASGRLVFTAGGVPVDADDNVVGKGDFAAQTRAVIENVLAALTDGGASAADVVKTTVYVAGTNRDDLMTVWDVVRTSAIAGAPSTLLGVTRLGYEGQLVEIEAVAVVD